MSFKSNGCGDVWLILIKAKLAIKNGILSKMF